MLARLSAFLIWALVTATAVFWALRLLTRAPEAPPFTVAAGDASAVRGDLTRLLGAAPVAAVPVTAAPETSSRFKLVGVMAPKRSATVGVPGHGLALIAVDGKPARAFPVGAKLDSDLVLQSVSLRSASIGPAQGAAAVTLELPPLPAPAAGSLPGLGARNPNLNNASPTFAPPLAQPMMNAPPPAQPRDGGAQTE